ncbi:hypothetical protein PLICRDRAFT_115528 [Plicaturopsis crispa FD-325 SS-3]|nr:hypothetical protein PLICRDRAFT_115528 [Plicaturopsis crispa FD-325 SS-3]
MAPVETEYYDLLGVPVDVQDTELKKAYRKQAMLFHPDKNHAPDAEEKFKDISKAYQILSDPNLRAVYDKNGAKMARILPVEKEGGVGMDDAAGFFANVFGGERFIDYIGEISLMKEMTSVATTMMSDEDKAELQKEMNGGESTPSSPPVAGGPATPFGAAAPASAPETPAASTPHTASPPRTETPRPQTATGHGPSLHMVSPGSPPPESSKSLSGKDKGDHSPKSRKSKVTPEQRQKLDELEKERRRAMEERIAMLTTKLIERLRPFVEAEHPGEKDDPETAAFEAKMKREADDLKLESFGVELLHTIGTVYMTKASSFMKSKKFLGIPGFWSRLKEKGALAKDAWGVIGSALGVQQMMQEMEKLQAKGELGEEELRALELDVTGRIMLASWRGTRFEVVQVLREAVDNVLKDPTVSDQVLYNRSKGLLLMGAIFKSTVPDESDQERRELERMVAEAASGKSKHHQLQAQARAAAKAKRDEELKASKSGHLKDADKEKAPAVEA